jgi:SAM-dependent methyltransferase
VIYDFAVNLFLLSSRKSHDMDATAYADMARVQDTHWWYRARRHILSSVIAALPLTKRAQILEIGCGPGGNLAMLEQFGDVCALEPYGPAADIARSRGNWLIKAGHLPAALDFEGLFDLIAAFDVIEHVEQDVAALAALGTRLGPQGRLVMSVPACPWLWSAHDVRNHHFRRYTRAQLVTRLQEAGFEIERMTYFNSLLFPLIAAVRLLQNLLKISSGAEESTPGPLANKILETIFRAEAGLLKRINFPVGVSLLAVARCKNSTR